jgi:hypothetical protein
MEIFPNIDHIYFLRNNIFIRNPSIDNFCRNYNYEIPISNFVCYNVGFIKGEKHVQSFRLLSNISSGINSFYIQWWNTMFVFNQDDIVDDSVSFWVHSGISLRKNFFLFEDRFSLFRSSFIYDEKNKLFIRLFLIEKFFIYQKTFICKKIFTTPSKCFLFRQRKNNGIRKRNNHKQKDLIRYLKSIIKECNFQNSLENQYPTLFEEIKKILKQNGNSSLSINR